MEAGSSAHKARIPQCDSSIGTHAVASASAVSPAISLAVSPSSGREPPTIETPGDKSSNQSGREPKSAKPNCYACKHRGGVPGGAHSSCHHPAVAHLHNGPGAVLGLLGKRGPLAGMEVGPNPLNVEGDPHGIRNGWFVWPLNFDPVWLRRCDGYEPKES